MDDLKLLWRQILSRPTMCLAVLAALLFYPASSVACSMAGCLNDGEEMRSAFTIKVTHDGKPLAGVSFHIVAKGTELFSGVTDETGTNQVKQLSPGLYWMNGERDIHVFSRER